MNAKKSKHKNRPNKPQNPTPPQNAESENKNVEKFQNPVEENSKDILKADERVPEILNALVAVPGNNLKDGMEKDSSGPKKPKRNRNKKKNQETPSFEDKREDLDKNNLNELSAETTNQSKDETKDCKQKNSEDNTENIQIEPTVRKKKGKNKNALDSSANNDVKTASEVVETVESTFNPDTKNLVSDITAKESKSKKKNKKNKKSGSDSERSEKNEEVLCTTAFKSILSKPEFENSEIFDIKNDKDDNKDTILSDSSISETTVRESSKCSTSDMIVEEKVVVDLANTGSLIIAELVEVKPDQLKGKKKNKKGEKQASDEGEMAKYENEESIMVITKEEFNLEEACNETALKSKETIQMHDNKNETISESILNTQTFAEESTKSKAKIVKPVEKKKKVKEVSKEVENTTVASIKQETDDKIVISQITEECETSKSNPIEDIPLLLRDEGNQRETGVDKSTFKSDKDEILVKDISSKSHKTKVTQHESACIPPKKNEDNFPSNVTINVNSEEQIKEQEDDSGFDKHRSKKDRKDPKDKQLVSEIQECVCNSSVEETKASKITTVPELNEDPLEHDIIKGDFKSDQAKSDTKDRKICLLEKVKSTSAVTPSEILSESITVPDDKHKNRKKSPKPAKLPKQDFFPKLQPKNDQKSDVTDETKVSKEFTPDIIEPPRSTSARIIDDNNNTEIREITAAESLLFGPSNVLTSPYIQDSGKTPLISPDVTSSRLTDSELIEKQSQNDFKVKTDLKSKVMEVNKDMEDLRISIERSLAELTSLDNMDRDIEAKNNNIEAGTKAPELDIKDNIVLEPTHTPEQPRNKFSDDNITVKTTEDRQTVHSEPPVCPSRKDNKAKNKSKKKGKDTASSSTSVSESSISLAATTSEDKISSSEEKQSNKTTEKESSNSSKEENVKQQQDAEKSNETEINEHKSMNEKADTIEKHIPIENFEDAMTSSADDVNQTFEIIADEAFHDSQATNSVNADSNPEINIIEPNESDQADKQKQNPLVSQPKNLLGRPNIPARSNRIDYKKEKNKDPNTRQAKVKIKDSFEIEKAQKESKESQTESKPKILKNNLSDESVTCVTSENDEFVYKYSFRKVFLASNCHVCKKELGSVRVPCNFCSLLFYCSQKHKDEDWPQHQALCFAVSTLVHLKGQKHLYADARGVTGHNYRLLRMQAIVSCEKVLKRKLLPWEQEALLYPRLCASHECREWRQEKLVDCAGCGQISFCANQVEHCPKSHARWCKSYALYQKLVVHQLTRGRLEPSLPGKILTVPHISDNINRLLADMYDEKIDMNEMQYAALTQLATAPLTAAYSYQLYRDKIKAVTNGVSKNSTFTIHVVGAELQFEADSLNKWETFFLHLKPELELLNLVLVGPELNPSNLPLDLLAKIKLCPTCRLDRRRIVFSFHDKMMYHDYRDGEDFLIPDIVCAFNPSISRSSSHDDSWSSTINSVFKMKVPFLVTSYSMNELQRDHSTIKSLTKVDFNTVSEAKFNPFASVRPDRNFITDDEIPLLFKNYCYMVLIGAF